jgi:ABC-2 type transport system ATP-binding protein/lipopolysaccharide transport system ATP-binding protein
MPDIILEAKNVSMKFNLNSEKIYSLKEFVIRAIKGKLHYEEFWALKDVSFELIRGESLGIIGLNGAGKSTLLRLIAGVQKPTAGSIRVYGSIAPLIELGAGFDPELTARDNIYLNGAFLGYNRSMMNKRLEEIIDFSELQEFIDVPLKNYSSGMQARLGFAIATLVKPDLLIVDEVLSVGDFRFQQKCEQRINEMLSGGTSVVFVSHSIEQVERLCSKALWLENHTTKMFGDSTEICKLYNAQ